jgi:hypothetical protein
VGGWLDVCVCMGEWLGGWMCVCVRACVRACVCDRQRERESAQEIWSFLHSVHLNVGKTTIVKANLLVAYVSSERERGKEYCKERYG